MCSTCLWTHLAFNARPFGHLWSPFRYQSPFIGFSYLLCRPTISQSTHLQPNVYYALFFRLFSSHLIQQIAFFLSCTLNLFVFLDFCIYFSVKKLERFLFVCFLQLKFLFFVHFLTGLGFVYLLTLTRNLHTPSQTEVLLLKPVCIEMIFFAHLDKIHFWFSFPYEFVSIFLIKYLFFFIWTRKFGVYRMLPVLVFGICFGKHHWLWTRDYGSGRDRFLLFFFSTLMFGIGLLFEFGVHFCWMTFGLFCHLSKSTKRRRKVHSELFSFSTLTFVSLVPLSFCPLFPTFFFLDKISVYLVACRRRFHRSLVKCIHIVYHIFWQGTTQNPFPLARSVAIDGN